MGFSWKSIGAALGVVAGVALALPTGGVSLALAAGMTIGTVGAVIVGIGGAALLGGLAGYAIGASLDSMIPEIPSATYDGDYPYLTVKNDVPIAEAFGGPLSIAGNLVRSNDPSESDWVKMIVSHCLGPIEEYLATFVNDKEFSALEKTHYKVHGYGTPGQIPLQINREDLFKDKYCAFKGVAVSGYKFDKASSDIGAFVPSIYEIIKGRQLIPIATNAIEGMKTWSRNPADILWDYFRRYDKPAILDEKLIGYWAFNESSGTVATDSSKYVKNGTLTHFPASPWVAAQVGNGLQFGIGGGRNDIVVCGTTYPLSEIGKTSFSLSFKIRFTSVVTQRIFSKYFDSGNYIIVKINTTGKMSVFE